VRTKIIERINSWKAERKRLSALRCAGYNVVEVRKPSSVYHVRKDGQEFNFKKSTSHAPLIYEKLLPQIAGGSTDIVVPELCELIPIQGDGTWVILKWLHGTTLREQLDDRLADSFSEVPETEDLFNTWLDSLEQIQAVELSSAQDTAQKMSRQAFFERIIKNFGREAVLNGWLSETEISRLTDETQRLWKPRDGRRYCITNGDHNFGNILQLPSEQIAIIDWDLARVTQYELEHTVSTQWFYLYLEFSDSLNLHGEFIRAALGKLEMDPDYFQATLLYKALVASSYCRHVGHKRTARIEILKRALSKEYISSIMSL
jgi:Phosphotransferase enzyme family